MAAKKALMKPIESLSELRRLCRDGSEEYRALAMVAARNLGGGDGSPNDWEKACCWIELNANEIYAAGVEDAEEATVEEVNFCRDCV